MFFVRYGYNSLCYGVFDISFVNLEKLCSYYVFWRFCSKNEIISECMVIVFCDNLLMFDVYDGYFMLICVYKFFSFKNCKGVFNN